MDKNERTKELVQIANLVLQGHSRGDIENKFNSSAEAIDRVFIGFEELAAQNPAQFMGFALEAFRDIYKRAIEAEDLTNALRAVKEIRDTAMKLTEFDL